MKFQKFKNGKEEKKGLKFIIFISLKGEKTLEQIETKKTHLSHIMNQQLGPERRMRSELKERQENDRNTNYLVDLTRTTDLKTFSRLLNSTYFKENGDVIHFIKTDVDCQLLNILKEALLVNLNIIRSNLKLMENDHLLKVFSKTKLRKDEKLTINKLWILTTGRSESGTIYWKRGLPIEATMVGIPKLRRHLTLKASLIV